MMQEKIWAAMEAIQEMNGAMSAEGVTPGMQSMGTHAYNILWTLDAHVDAPYPTEEEMLRRPLELMEG